MPRIELDAGLERIVTHYIENVRPLARKEARWFSDQPTLEDAIHHASLALDEHGRRLGHQRRIKEEAMQKARTKLLARKADLEAQPNFALLHRTICELLAPYAGLADLYLYDVSARIGAWLGKSPSAVYLHAGTRDGARALHLPADARTLHLGELPAPLRVLEPDEIENLLCIYKKELALAARGQPFSLPKDFRCYMPDAEE